MTQHNEAPGGHIGDGSAHRPETDAILEARNLGVFYGSVAAVRGIDLDVPRRRITAVVGPSGCGKSSFLATLNRITDMIPHCRVEGTLHLDGVDVMDPALDLIPLRCRVGMIFQKPNPFPLSIRRNLDLPLREHGIRAAETRQEIIAQCLRDVGLWDEVHGRLDTPAQALSGGQQQRLCIARALVLEPEVLLFDEPCSALDPISSGLVEDLIVRLKARASIVIVTHNLSQARRIADHVAMFWHDGHCGRLIEQGPAQQLFEAPEHPITASYFGGLRG